ncbi:MAG: IS5/IS1182 family transposase, partial [Prevotella sp.]|nr:IS5/IS1182 family transposase [Prevotella sp.]
MKKTTIYRRQKVENLFEEELTIAALSAMGNPLEQLAVLVDFEMFRHELEDIL